VAVAPPTFVFFARHADQVHFSYKRFLENQLRAEFGFDGTPIRLIFRERASDRAGRRETPGGAAGGQATRRRSGARDALLAGQQAGAWRHGQHEALHGPARPVGLRASR